MKDGYRVSFLSLVSMALLSASVPVPLGRDCCVITAAFITGGPEGRGERKFFQSK